MNFEGIESMGSPDTAERQEVETLSSIAPEAPDVPDAPEKTELTGSVAELKEKQAKDLLQILDRVKPEPGYSPDREQQYKVLLNLPDRLVEKLHAHLFAVEKEQEYFRELRGEDLRPDEVNTQRYDNIILRGELFEMLVEADPDFGTKNPEGEELLSLMHHPRRFRLDKTLGHVRTPDLAFISMDSGNKIVIEGAGEAKLGFLDRRALQQLSASGIQRGFRSVSAYVNYSTDIREHGLIDLANKKEQLSKNNPRAKLIKVSDEFDQVLIVPADRDTEKPETFVKPSNNFKDVSEYEELIQLLSEDVRIEKAKFSYDEVRALTDHLHAQILDRIGSSEEQF